VLQNPARPQAAREITHGLVALDALRSAARMVARLAKMTARLTELIKEDTNDRSLPKKELARRVVRTAETLASQCQLAQEEFGRARSHAKEAT